MLSQMTILKSAPFTPALASPLYQQLYAHLRTAILSGKLKSGTRLPSTRAMADELGLSRNTVLNAYEQLLAEGYLESTTGSGTFVARVLPETLLGTPTRKAAKTTKRSTFWEYLYYRDEVPRSQWRDHDHSSFLMLKEQLGASVVQELEFQFARNHAESN